MSVEGRPDPTRVPCGIDTSKPSIARVYDAVLNGKDNFAVDRAIRDQLLEVSPYALDVPRDNRAWLIRVMRYLVDTVGIDQFLDCGSGLPTAENTHQVAQRLNPDASVVYVDNDPVVAAYGRVLLEENANTKLVSADIRDPAALLALPEVSRFVELDRPLGLLLVGILHHVLDRPYEVMQGYVAALPPGSYVAVSHFYNPRDDSLVAKLAGQAEKVLLSGDLGSGRFRTRDEIMRFFDGLELIEPGLVTLAEWWPDGPPGEIGPHRRCMLGAVARKP